MQFNCGHFKKANEFLESSYGVDGIIDWNLGKAPAANPAAKKVVETVPKEDAVDSAAGVPDVQVMKTAEADTNGDKNGENKESGDKEPRQREHDDTDYGSDGLE